MSDQSHPVPDLAARLHLETVKARLFGRTTGARLDRYTVLGKLGEGGTGAVFAAHDPALDRTVAIKLLHDFGRDDAEGDTRRWFEALEQEARAMARLSHPNVVHVYEVGEHERQRYLVMELVRGTTLRQWQTRARERHGPRRATAEITAMYVQAGQGLAAAHRAGLIHRDFKPDNVLVDEDERAKVCDFGLARVFEAKLAPPTLPDALLHAIEGSSARTAMVGTPAYMAPEQLRGESATERADQFAFCVALYEALEGERPFGGDAPAELFENVLEGNRRAAPRGSAVPSWLRRVVERGLAVDPEARWPSMDALLDALSRGRRRARVRTGLVALAGLAAIAGGGQLYRMHDVAQRTAACEESGREIALAWSPARKQALRDALVATGASHAATTADRSMPWLDRQASAWQQARIESCLDASVRERWDDDRLARSLWCLQERRMELQSLVDELTRADAAVLQEAVPAAASLQSVAPCRDEWTLGMLALPHADERAAIAEARSDVTRVEALLRTGRFDAGLVQARAALERAEALDWPPLTAAARLQLGRLLEQTGPHDEAEATLEGAYFEAAKGVAPQTALDAATLLVFVVGYHGARHDEARRWGRHAEVALVSVRDGEQLGHARLLAQRATIERLTGAHDDARARLEQALAIQERSLGPEHPTIASTLRSLALVEHAAGRYSTALGLHERALAIDEQALGPEHPTVSFDLTNLGNLHQLTGELAEAKALHERALAILEEVMDPDHPSVAKNLNNLGNVYRDLGEHDKAKVFYERAITLAEQAFGPEHPTVAAFLGNLGTLCMRMGQQSEARVHYERAAVVLEKVLGPEHPDVAAALINLAAIHQDMGARNEAKTLYLRALDIQQRTLGPEHPSMGPTLVNLGMLYELEGAHDEARPLYEQALALLEKALGADHPDVAYCVVLLADLSLAQGHPQRAVTLARRAVATLEQLASAPTGTLASARFALARALWDAPEDGGRDRERAAALADQARDALRHAGEGWAAHDLAEIEAWQDAHE
ncbi:serine/threonine-protein kinase [Paraliomyxa miuraensis]|uniref:serine/threonine-protein kinase n=1 Tax=Paraliomyxa miuraensis TaxID=376150 RepID=UPI00225B100F|nr:serine/threonine-protein kinase [Paraliomyxa miuraensis]MCX4244883.1 serine/threonine-protein kinase [Paraliomyxa miuraensis]